ncbi:MAG: hypothetical protein RIR26_1271 [Pseudomonadota bacterium]
MSPLFLKCDPFNFVPLQRTPWGGKLIVKVKQKSLSQPADGWPDRVGESWEISTDAAFPSRVVSTRTGHTQANHFFSDMLQSMPEHFLGQRIARLYGAHCPLLLKWLNALEPLSVQVHPTHSHPALKSNECGKPESWLVLATEPGGHVFLGFKENIPKEEIIQALQSDRAADVMHCVTPEVGDSIAIPPGCVHATGPGVLIAEPQFVLPARSGKTWRISDWGRLYNEKGERDPNGKPRELHVDAALSAIDWTLPRGKALEKALVHALKHQQVLPADHYNPFPVQYFSQSGSYTYDPLVEGQFSLVTCWEGQIRLHSHGGDELVLKSGESGFIAAAAGCVDISLTSAVPSERPSAAFFGFIPPEPQGV